MGRGVTPHPLSQWKSVVSEASRNRVKLIVYAYKKSGEKLRKPRKRKQFTVQSDFIDLWKAYYI